MATDTKSVLRNLLSASKDSFKKRLEDLSFEESNSYAEGNLKLCEEHLKAFENSILLVYTKDDAVIDLHEFKKEAILIQRRIAVLPHNPFE